MQKKSVDRRMLLVGALVLIVAGGADFGWNRWRGSTRNGLVGAGAWPDGL